MKGRWPWIASAVLYAVLTLIYFRPLLSAFGTALPHDIGDPGLTTWMLWWNAQAAPLTERWWNAPIFFPAHGAFALSETLLAPALVAVPLIWSGVSAVGAHNAAFMLSFPVAALAAHALAYQLTRRHDVALVAGLAFGFHPYRASQLPHIQLQWSMFMPLCLLALHRYLDRRRTRDLVIAGVCWALNGLCSGYYLVFFAVLTGLWMLWFLRARRDWLAVGGTLALASAIIAPVLVGSVRIQQMLGFARDRGEIESFSADLSSLWIVSPHVWLPAHWSLASRPEGELYQGIAIVLIPAIAAWLGWKSEPLRPHRAIRRRLFIAGALLGALALVVRMTGGWEGQWLGIPYSMTHAHRLTGLAIWLFAIALFLDARLADLWRRRSIFAFYALAAAVLFVFALGPVVRAFDVRLMDKAPYYWLMQLPGGSAVRVPARFAMLVALCLAQATALGLARVTRRGSSPVLTGVVSLAVLADGWVLKMPVAQAPMPMALQSISSDVPVIELPTLSLYTDTPAMLRGVGHGHWLVNGFSGFVPPYYPALQQGLLDGDGTVLEAVRKDGPLLAIVNNANDPNGAMLHMLRTLPSAILHSDTDIGPAYLVSGPNTLDTTKAGSPLEIAGLETNRNERQLPALVDRDLSTRWNTNAPQRAGDEIRVILADKKTITGVEIDLAGVPYDYPRGLRVTTAIDEQTPQIAWSGEVAGRVVRASLDDPARTSVFVPFPAGVVANRITLTVTRNTLDAFWSIAELRVLGGGTSPEVQAR